MNVVKSLLGGEQLPMQSQAATDVRDERALQIRQNMMKAIVDLDYSQRYHRTTPMRPSLEETHVLLPKTQSAVGRFRGRQSSELRVQLDGSADAADASSDAGEVLAPLSTVKWGIVKRLKAIGFHMMDIYVPLNRNFFVLTHVRNRFLSMTQSGGSV